ncbi:hypothetical protein BBK82_17245 [Lentzea guizhouensis]|uniref:Uncharacterized protein n=1 Tax=Lentzea guizhouensis TaxID=1586287 RepID=A0A1B2HIK7_9PSEU|nr:hypothetical protein BBK82_17245 [Lentzea guizhouensis]
MAAREAVRAARREAERPRWRRLLAWPTVFVRSLWHSLWWFARELGEALGELLMTLFALGFVAAVGLLVSAAWQTAPLPTAVLVAGAVAFLVYGGVEFFRERRRGRLTMVAVCAFGFVALWVALPLLPFWPYWLF